MARSFAGITGIRSVKRVDGGSGGLVGRSPAQECLHPLFKNPSRQKHATATSVAAQPDVSAEAHDGPVNAAAWVRLAQPHLILEEEIDWRVAVDSHGIVCVEHHTVTPVRVET